MKYSFMVNSMIFKFIIICYYYIVHCSVLIHTEEWGFRVVHTKYLYLKHNKICIPTFGCTVRERNEFQKDERSIEFETLVEITNNFGIPIFFIHSTINKKWRYDSKRSITKINYEGKGYRITEFTSFFIVHGENCSMAIFHGNQNVTGRIHDSIHENPTDHLQIGEHILGLIDFKAIKTKNSMNYLEAFDKIATYNAEAVIGFGTYFPDDKHCIKQNLVLIISEQAQTFITCKKNGPNQERNIRWNNLEQYKDMAMWDQINTNNVLHLVFTTISEETVTHIYSELINDTIIGMTNVALIADNCTYSECNFGNLIADAVIDYNMRFSGNGNGWTDAAVFMYRSRFIRTLYDGSDGRPRNITIEDIHMALPYTHYVHTVEKTGKQIRLDLESSVAYRTWTTKSLYTEYNFIFAGLRVIFDLGQPNGKKVRSIKIRCADCPIPLFEQLNYEKKYKVIERNPINHADDISIQEMLLEYISRHSPICSGLDNRVAFTHSNLV